MSIYSRCTLSLSRSLSPCTSSPSPTALALSFVALHREASCTFCWLDVFPLCSLLIISHLASLAALIPIHQLQPALLNLLQWETSAHRQGEGRRTRTHSYTTRTPSGTLSHTILLRPDALLSPRPMAQGNQASEMKEGRSVEAEQRASVSSVSADLIFRFQVLKAKVRLRLRFISSSTSIILGHQYDGSSSRTERLSLSLSPRDPFPLPFLSNALPLPSAPPRHNFTRFSFPPRNPTAIFRFPHSTRTRLTIKRSQEFRYPFRIPTKLGARESTRDQPSLGGFDLNHWRLLECQSE